VPNHDAAKQHPALTVSTPSTPSTPPVPLRLRGASLAYRERVLWSGLDLDVSPGEFVAVLGGNGSGKTSLLRAALGLQPLTSGEVTVNGTHPRQGRRRIGYVPQQRRMDPLTPLRARDMVGLGLDGHRWGMHPPPRSRRSRVEAALASVAALDYADEPVGILSGGEQQRIRVAQALISDPRLLLCDEPLLSLDLHHQRAVAGLVNQRRISSGTAVVFVTHEINPVLPYVDRVLYLASGRFRIGAVEDVLTSDTLTNLYGAPVDVIRVHGRIIVSGIPDPTSGTASSTSPTTASCSPWCTTRSSPGSSSASSAD
jgi:zinc/manganese transport system ATP-binding protein